MTDNIVIEAFTELAPRYERVMDWELRFMWGLAYREFVNLLVQAASIGESDKVLDVATGTAMIPISISSRVGAEGHIVGLDITLAMLQHGVKNLQQVDVIPSIDLLCASAMNMPFSDGIFDAVICGLGMHHLDIFRTLSEMKRVLKGDGRLVLGVVGVPPFWRTWWGKKFVVTTIKSVYQLTHSGIRAQAEIEAFSNIHTADEWYDILSTFGFTDIEISEIPPRFGWGPNALIITAPLCKTI